MTARAREHARPPIRPALLGPGRSLDEGARRRHASRLGHDLRDVRVHDDERAAFVARSLGTRGFALGGDVVLAERDERLLAHELAHVAQQRRRGPSRRDPEAGARLAERGRALSAAELGSAPDGGFYAQDEEERPARVEPALTLDWDSFVRGGRFTLGVGPLTLGGVGVPPAVLRPPAPPGGPTVLPPPPAATTAPAPAAAAGAPSRLPVASSGRFSLGLRLGFPEAEARTLPGAPPSALQTSLARAQLTHQILTGQVPRGWDAIDKAQLAGAVWGIFSTHIAPDFARRITSGLSKSTGAGGPSYELDLVLFTDFSGGGLSFSVAY